MSSKSCIVFDTYQEVGVENRIFEVPEVEKGFGECFFRHIHQESLKHGLEIMTGDLFLQQPAGTYDRAYCISDMISGRTEEILAREEVTPAIVFSMESPIIAKKFYFNLKKLAGRYTHSYQFEGTRGRLADTSTTFHPMHYPVCGIPEISSQSWSEKEMVIMINTNKRAADYETQSIQARVKSLYTQLKYSALRRIDPLLRGEELYVRRIKAIKYFSEYGDFHLYGRRWDQPIPGFGEDYARAAKKVYKGEIENSWTAKLEVLSRHKFCICFENFRFPGYVTEKITDCLIAGCVPIYLGAQNIEDIVSKEVFIDMTDFADFEALNKRLNAFSEEEHEGYLSAGRKFLKSPEFERFNAGKIAQEMIELIVKEEEKANV